jgi:5-formyltetrahydrofolate cyclo-ligase
MSLTAKQALRQRLLEERLQFVTSPPFAAAHAALAEHLHRVLLTLEPELLGVYWPQPGEFNAVVALQSHADGRQLKLALPFAQRNPTQLHYRAWSGQPPTAQDDCNIPTSLGAPVIPDVVLVPCVGHTPEGLRLGYGGGYFDRWLAQHPGATAIGVAWSLGELTTAELNAQPHDVPLTLVITESGVAAAP